MSILYGLLKEGGVTVIESELRHLAAVTDRYATGAGSVHVQGRLGMGVQPYSSHLRSELERGPTSGPHGHALSFDGRLDNYKELSEELGFHDPKALSDSQIVLAAFARWSEACFSRFVGDWALALWDEKDQSLYLARDHAGTRTLYFRHEQGEVAWATYLDTFHTREVKFQLSHDYAACYLAGRFVRDLTPYEGIRSVPPAHYVRVRKGLLSRHQHWSSTVETTIGHNTDKEYEARFLTLFQQSVERRTGPGAPILAQLSGGMDSTAIVCMSDQIRRTNDPSSEILDTVSFYDDSEASLNERPYFSITEAKRGKVGTHLDMAFSQRTFEPYDGTDGIYLIPGADSFSIAQERRFHDAVWQKGYRSVLSGIGGDEVLGGIPDPLPELADYLVSGKVRRLLRQSVAWSLVDRSPLLATLGRTASYAACLYLSPKPKDRDVPPWILPSLRKRTWEIEASHQTLRTRAGIAPHCLDNSLAWWSVMETLPHLFPQLLVRPEYRYPFLDKDLVNYLFSIPREQILRPGRRRSLMRRALANIVPHEVLERRRKAYQLRAPLHTLQQAHDVLGKLLTEPMLADAGLIDASLLRQSLQRTAEGDAAWWQAMLRTIALELWLRSIVQGNIHRAGNPPLRLTA
jgi:asparagine synthase (glutamine-hydrolysing)